MFAPPVARSQGRPKAAASDSAAQARLNRIATPDTGKALDPGVRAHFEPRFGVSFADVRVHDGAAATRNAGALEARAYTLGNHIVFGAGAHAPGSPAGRATMAHELAHIVQQRGASAGGALSVSTPGSAAEREADRIAAASGGNGAFQVRERASPAMLYRQHVHMSSGRFVGDMAGAENNQKDEVLDVITKLVEIGATSQADYQSEKKAVAAVAASPVPVATIPKTIAGITAAEEPKMTKQVAAAKLNVTLNNSVGKGQTNDKNDIIRIQDQLHNDWHLEAKDYATESAAAAAAKPGTVPEAVIPKTIEGIGKQKIAIVAGQVGAEYHKQLAGGVEMGKLDGTQATWTQSHPGSGSTFEKWASAATEQSLFALASSTEINCWEMILYAALKGGLIKWKFVHDLYTTSLGAGWGSHLVTTLSRGSRTPYLAGDANTPRPQYGQIVFFNNEAHVALANGVVDSAGRAQVWTFWPPPNTAFTGDATNRHATLDKVKVSTIEELIPHIAAPAMVNFAKPPW